MLIDNVIRRLAYLVRLERIERPGTDYAQVPEPGLLPPEDAPPAEEPDEVLGAEPELFGFVVVVVRRKAYRTQCELKGFHQSSCQAD